MLNVSSCIIGHFASFEKCVFNSFAHLLIGLFALLEFNFWSSLYVLDMNPLSDE
jgi:hypothetical protein